MRRAALLALAIAVGGCTSMQEQYNVRRDDLSCEDANRYAFQSVRSLGYAVGEFRLATVGNDGIVKGKRTEDDGRVRNATVHVRCEPSGVVLSAADDQLLKQDLTFTRGFYLTFTSMADHADAGAAWQEKQTGGTTTGGAKFKIEPQLGLESKLDFEEDLAGAGVLAVKVTVENGSDRTYRLDPASIELRPAGASSRTAQMPIEAAAAALARSAAADAGAGAPAPDPQRFATLLRGRALTARTLAPGARAEGFVYFPTGQYARARAMLVDVETEESEGFVVEF
jgi:hypothetical protein